MSSFLTEHAEASKFAWRLDIRLPGLLLREHHSVHGSSQDEGDRLSSRPLRYCISHIHMYLLHVCGGCFPRCDLNLIFLEGQYLHLKRFFSVVLFLHL